MSTLSSSEKDFLWALSKSSEGLTVDEITRKTGFCKRSIYTLYGQLLKHGYVMDIKYTRLKDGKRGRPKTLFRLTEDGRKQLNAWALGRQPKANVSYIIDLGSEGEVLASLDSPPTEKENKYLLEAYWLSNAPSITPILGFLNPYGRTITLNHINEVDIHFKIKVPRISRDVLHAANFFRYLEEDAWSKQYQFWSENIEWLMSSVAKGQGVWNTPYKDVGEVCDLIMKSPPHIFEAVMLGLKSAENTGEICHVFLHGDIYYLNLVPLNIFEYLSVRLSFISEREKTKTNGDLLGYWLFNHFIKNREVKGWIKRCLKRDGERWLSRIPFESFGFKRNKDEVESSWTWDTDSALGLGFFFSIKRENWRKIGCIMNILLDTIMMRKPPSRLGDLLNYSDYTDNLILEAWSRVKDLWLYTRPESTDNKLKTRIKGRARKEYGCFFPVQRQLRDACLKFLDTVYKEWKKIPTKNRKTGIRELLNYLPSKHHLPKKLRRRKQYVLPPDKFGEYKRMIKIISDNTQAIDPEEKLLLKGKVLKLAIFGGQRQKFIAGEEWDPAKKAEEFLKKVDYEDFMSKIKELAQKCPRYIEKP